MSKNFDKITLERLFFYSALDIKKGKCYNINMKYETDIYYSSQNEPYEKLRGYVVDEPDFFCMGFFGEDYTFEVKSENGKVSVSRKGEQSYDITLSALPSVFSLSTPFGSLCYTTTLKDFSLEKKPNAYSLTLVYSLVDNSGHSQDNVLKMKGRV